MADFHDSMGRIGRFAAIDVLGTAIIALYAGRMLGWNPWHTIAYAFILGEAVHLYFKLQTPITEMLGTRTGKRTLSEPTVKPPPPVETPS
jgi:hypothetical protein